MLTLDCKVAHWARPVKPPESRLKGMTMAIELQVNEQDAGVTLKALRDNADFAWRAVNESATKLQLAELRSGLARRDEIDEAESLVERAADLSNACRALAIWLVATPKE